MRRIILLTALTSSLTAFAQQPRTFTYDAAGNRIAINVPTESAPEAPLFYAEDDIDEITVSIDVKETTGIFSVSLKGWMEREPVHIYVYTAGGQLITESTTKQTNFSLNITAHPAGVYIVEATQGEKHVARKFTKEK